MRNKLTILCLAILIVASAFSYMPAIFANSASYGRLHIVILLSTVALFVFSGNYNTLFRQRLMNNVLYPLILFMLLICLFYGIGLSVGAIDIMQIAIVYASLWIGHELRLKDNIFVALLFLYGLVAIFLGYTAITTYLTSFLMEENAYAIEAKNQIGVIVAVAGFVMFYIAQCSSNKKLSIISYILFLVLLVLMAFIRCRTALLAFLITAFLTVYKVNDSRRLLAYLFCGTVLMIVFSSQISEILQDVFVGDKVGAKIDDLSSNRIERNEQSIRYLNDHLFAGELITPSGIEIIHNYILNRLVRYGIWAIPLLFVYFTIGYKAIKQTLRYKEYTLYDIGYFAMLIPFICSLLEPDAPFGPGTVYSFVYILFGYSLKNSLNRS